MKKISLFILSVAITFAFASCDTDAEKAFYEPTGGAELAFSSKTLAKNLVSADNGEFAVTINRGKAKGALSVPVIFTTSSPLFSLETANAEFADGKYETTIKVLYDFSELSAAETYKLELQISDTLNLSATLLNVVNITARQKLEYLPLGVGRFNSEFFEEEWEVEIVKADGLDAYRILDAYYEGYHIDFLLDGENVVVGKQNTGYNHPDYGFVYFTPRSATMLPNKAGITFIAGFTVDAGTFGDMEEVLTFNFK